MKRIIALSLVLLMVMSFCLVSCDKNKGDVEETTDEITTVEVEPTESAEEPVESDTTPEETTAEAVESSAVAA